MTLGFIVGKFYPPHRGHKYLINTARAQVDRLIVMIAAHPSQTIPGTVREKWLKQIHPDCEIHLVPDTLADDSDEWAKFTIDYLGRAPDVVFTSENYGPRYATAMGCRHVMVDRSRQTVPISGTRIRENPAAAFSYLEPCVRAWFIPRVVLIGAESTGKTTMAERLAHHYGTVWVAEYGREHWEKKVAGLEMTDPLPRWEDDEFLHIAQTQQAREWAAAEKASRILICDTNAFATGTWYERYRGKRDSAIDHLGDADRADLYLFSRSDAPFVQDGFRDGEKIRDWMDARFEAQLRSGKVPYVSLSGDWETRFRDALSAIDGRFFITDQQIK